MGRMLDADFHMEVAVNLFKHNSKGELIVHMKTKTAVSLGRMANIIFECTMIVVSSVFLFHVLHFDLNAETTAEDQPWLHTATTWV